MQRSFIFIFLLFIFSFLFGASDVSAGTLIKPANNLGLVGYWSFDDATSTRATDFSGRENHGTLNTFSAPATLTSGWNHGRLGTALTFDGSTDYVGLGDKSIFEFSTGPFTVSAWVRLDSTASQADLKTIFSKYDARNPGHREYRIGVQWDSVDSRFELSGGVWDTGQTSYPVREDAPFPLDTWVHVAIVRDGQTLTLYRSGTQVDTISNGPDTIRTSSGEARIGNIHESAGFDTNPFDGVLDEVRLYNRALTASEVRALYQVGSQKVNYAPKNIVSNGLVNYWTFDGYDIRDKVYNIVGTTNGYLFNTATSTAKTIGKIGQALKFDGTDDYVDMGLWTSEQTVYTVSLWMKGTGTNLPALHRGDSNECNYNPLIKTTGIQEGGCAGANDLAISANDGNWHHLVAWRNGSSFRAYVDGALANSKTLAAFTYTNMSNDRYSIGATFHSSGAETYLAGSVDDVRTYNRALSESEIKTLYNMGGSKINTSQANTPGTTLGSGLVGYWSFNGPDVTDKVYDRSGQGNDGYIRGTGTSTAKTIGKIGQALQFDGSNDYVNVGDVASLDNIPEMTISFWAKPDSLAQDNAFVSKTPGPAEAHRFQLSLGGTGYGGEDDITLSVNDGSNQYAYSTANIISVGTWVHVSMVFNGALSGNSNRLKLYVNGAQQSLTFGGGVTIPSVTSSSNTGSLVFGSEPAISAGTRYFDGFIDEVRIYNRALSASEVKQLYNLGR